MNARDFPVSRREMRAMLFWVVRWLYGAGEYHRGPIEIVVGGSPSGDQFTFRPQPGDEVYDGADGPATGGPLVELAPQLVATMLSPDARAIMRLVADKAPVPAKVIVSGVGIERSRCYVLIQDLRERGLIREGVDGYELGAAEVWAELRRSG